MEISETVSENESLDEEIEAYKKLLRGVQDHQVNDQEDFDQILEEEG